MSGVMAIVAWLAALNPARTRLGLPEHDDRGRMRVVAPGVVGGVAALAGLAAVAGPLLDALRITPEMFRIAAGLVLMIAAARMALVPEPPPEPVASGPWAAVWPVAYPRVVSPETITLAVTTGASDGLQPIALSIAGATLIALAAVPLRGVGRRVVVALGRLLAAALVLVAVWLAVEGIRQV